MSAGVHFERNLVFKDLDLATNVEVLEFLTTKLHEKGYVKEGYKEAILEREKEYPTGLPSADIKIAIPHANHTLVNKATLAIAVLKNPVAFRAMDDPDKELNVRIVIMMALSEPHGHIEMLQKIVKLIQNAEALKEITEASSSEEVISKLEPYLL